MSKKWVISDLHFGHDNIVKFSRDYREGNNAEEHDEWFREIQEYEGYKIGNKGTVLSFKRCSNGKKLSPYVDKDGYLCVTIRKNNKPKGKKVHRLVSEVFIANPQNLPQVNHKDGNKQNNSVENLEWVSNTENQRHAWANDLKTSKLTVQDVRNIKNMIHSGLKNKDIYKKYNIDRSTVSNIRRGRTWKFV